MDPLEHPVFSSSRHNDSVSTLNNSNNNTEQPMDALQQENEVLRKKITYLQKIIELKDSTINELNAKLLLYKSGRGDEENAQEFGDISSQVEAASHVEKESDPTNDKYSENPLVSPTLTDNSVSRTTETMWEIPQRNSNRSLRKETKSSPALSASKQQQPEAEEHQNKTHAPHLSISSITSSHYSESDDQGIQLEIDEDYQDSQVPNASTDENNDSTQNMSTSDTIDKALKLDLKNGNLTLGSSPRRLSPHRKSFSFEGLQITSNESSHQNADESYSAKSDDFNFNQVNSPDDPVYKKLTQESLYSTNSSPITEYFNQKNNNEVSTPYVNVPVRVSSPSPMGISLSSNSPKLLNPSTSFQNRQPETGPVEIPLPQTPSNPPHLPVHPTSSTPNNNRNKVDSIVPLQKRVTSADDSEKFLLNSLNHAVIRIESLVDPSNFSTQSDPRDPHSNSLKRSSYKVSFMVYTDENAPTLTPIYRVRKSYIELLMMDKAIRPQVPNLPLLPDISYVSCLNFRYWASSKNAIQTYIIHLLNLFKNQKPFNPNHPVWKNFSNYFEFKMDLNDLENPEYSVLHLQNKISYLLYVKKNFGGRTYDFINMVFPSSSNVLTINFVLSKTKETLQKEEIQLTSKDQEIVVKKRKKLATKTWVFFAESKYDADDLCKRLLTWIGNETLGPDEEEMEINSSDTNEAEELLKSSTEQSLSSPSLNGPWKLFKKTNKLQSQPSLYTSPRQSPSTFSSIGSSVPGSPSRDSIPSSSHRSRSSTTAVQHSDVLNFKAMPYESNKLSVDNSNSNNSLRSPIKQGNPRQGEIFFQPIDDSPKYFKSTLQHSYDLCPKYKLYGFNVPSIVYQCITYLYQQGGEGFEGIFRLNGMMSEVNRIQEIFNEEHDCDLSKLTPNPDVHSIATLLKRYLRYLQDRLISDDITFELCSIINKSENKGDDGSLSSDAIEQFKSVFNRLPELNRNSLYALFRYLGDVLKMGKHNKMSVSAMSVLMGPNLTQKDGGGQICAVLLENFSTIFQRN